MESIGTPIFWIGFALLVVVMLVLDLGVFNRRSHVVSAREAGLWSGIWVGLALLFNWLVAHQFGGAAGQAFLAGYLIEKSLSVDNLFVFFMIFASFRVAPEYQHRLLFWGILGAVVLRTIMVFGGSWLLGHVHGVVYLFGAFLAFTGIKMLARPSAEPHPERGRAVRLLRRIVPTTDAPHGHKLFVREGGRLVATSLFIVLVVIALSDVVFAVDSILAIFAVTEDPFIVLTSNVFAVMGLRSLYFLLAGLARRFVYLQPGLALVLVFVGFKMAISDLYKIPVAVALLTVAGLLGLSIVASLVKVYRDRAKAPFEQAPAPTPPPSTLSAAEATSVNASRVQDASSELGK